MEELHRADLGEVLGALGTCVQLVGLDEEDGAEADGGDRVEPAGGGEGPHQQRGGDHDPGVGHDLTAHVAGGLDHRQHRHVDLRVVLAVAQRQGPGVRRGPEEDDHEQDQRLPVHRVGDRGPADQGREAARDAAPDDVLGGAPLEQHRVDEDVEGVGGQREARGEPVHEEAEHQHRQHGQHGPEDQGCPRGDHVPRQGPASRTPHLLVDVAVVDAVEDRGRTGREDPADDGGRDQADARDALGGEEHHRNGGQQQQLDHAGLRQGDVRRDDIAH